MVILGADPLEKLSGPIPGTPNYLSGDREENASRPPQYEAPQQHYQQNQQNQPPAYGSGANYGGNNVMSPQNGGQQVLGFSEVFFMFSYFNYSPFLLNVYLAILSLIKRSCMQTQPGNRQLKASPGEAKTSCNVSSIK